MRALKLALFVGLALFAPAKVGAQTYAWQGPNNGLWSAPGNWTPSGGPPNGAGSIANFGSNTIFNATAIIDGTYTIGAMTYEPMTSFSRILNTSSGGGLILNNGASAGLIAAPQTTNSLVSFTINAPMTIAGNNAVEFSAGLGNGIATLQFNGAIGGAGSLVTVNPIGQGGRVAFSAANTYGGGGSVTAVNGGMFQAVDGVGLPSNSALLLNGGSLEFGGSGQPSPAFTRPLGTGPGQVQLQGAIAGFSNFVNAEPLVVRLNNSTSTVVWGSTHFNPGILRLGAFGSEGGVTFENGVDLNGATRTIQVDTNVRNDYSVSRMTGAISNSSGTAGLTKTGLNGVLELSGTNTYNGQTAVLAGVLRAADGVGLPAASNLRLDGQGVFGSSIVHAVYQPRGSNPLIRSVGTGPGQIQFNGVAGLSAWNQDVAVRLNNSTSPVVWGSAGFTLDTLYFHLGNGVLDMQNGLNLNGATRRIYAGGEITSYRGAAGASDPHARISGVISNGGLILNSAPSFNQPSPKPGVLELTGANTYSGPTTVFITLRADDGIGLPSASNLALTGAAFPFSSGVFESRGPATFTRGLGTGAGQLQINGGGFSASGGTHAIRIGGNASTLTLGTSNFIPIGGSLAFGSNRADALTDFQNGLNLAGGLLTVGSFANPASLSDRARISGSIGNGRLTITSYSDPDTHGSPLLELTGLNTYSGQTILQRAMVLRAADGVGLPSPSNLDIKSGVLEVPGPALFNRMLGAGPGQLQMNFSTNFSYDGSGFSAIGGPLTVRINDSTAALTYFTGVFRPAALRFGSEYADNVVEFQNDLNLNNQTLPIWANASPTYRGPVVRLTGIISNGGISFSGSGNFDTQDGAIELTGANTYAGGTTFTAARVFVNNATGSGLGTGPVSVTAVYDFTGKIRMPGTLGGSGRIALAAGNSVTFANLTRLQPGGGADNSFRIETSGSGQLQIGTNSATEAGAVWAARILSAGPGGVAAGSGGSTIAFPEPSNNTFLDTAGRVSLALNTHYEVDGSGAAFTPGEVYSYIIGRADSAANLNNGVLLNITDPSLFTVIGFEAQNFSLISNGSGQIILSFTAVPEPACLLAVAGGLAAIVLRRRRPSPIAAVLSTPSASISGMSSSIEPLSFRTK